MPFPPDPHTAAFTCCHVLDGAPIAFVSHDHDGDWQAGASPAFRAQQPLLR